MSKWAQRIASLIKSKSEKEHTTSVSKSQQPSSMISDSTSNSLYAALSKLNNPTKSDSIVAFPQDMSESIAYNNSIGPESLEPNIPDSVKVQTNIMQEEQHVAHDPSQEEDDNIKALQKLRDLPRGMGTKVDSRIAAIKNLLGEKEIFKTLQMLRWPKGIVCPRCKSSNVVRRDPPADAPDRRHYYVCLNCKADGALSDFDDFTGLPVGSLHGLRQWILCWYLIGFCSISQIAKVLGLSMAEISKIAAMGAQISDLAEDIDPKLAKEIIDDRKSKKRKDAYLDRIKKTVEQQEEDTKSQSKNIYKPGYHSKK